MFNFRNKVHVKNLFQHQTKNKAIQGMAGDMAKQIIKACYAAQMKMSNSRKSSASRYGWQVLPDHIFGGIFLVTSGLWM